MFRKIIITTDLSKASYSLVGCLESLKGYGTEECLLLQCLSMQESASIAFSYSTDVLDTILEEQKEIIEKQGFKVETRTVTSSPKYGINKIAKEEGYSVIVVGAEKENLMKAHLYGSFAYDVIGYAKKPVLLIRLKERMEDGEVCIDPVSCGVGNHILFPTDFSENAETAFGVLKQMVADGARKVTLVHIQDKARIVPHLSDRLEEFNRIDSERLEIMKRAIMEIADVEVDIVIRFGSPTVEILNLVEEKNIQLVVMGSQGRGFVKELFIGSVSNNIARKSESSVMLVPAYRG